LQLVDDSMLNQLVEDAYASSLRRARILLHENRDDSIQQMLLVVTKDSLVERHRHPAMKSETYIILEGILEVEYWDEINNNNFIKRFGSVGSGMNLPIIGKHKGGIWHTPRSVTDHVVYFEIYEGPFRKEVDVEYWSELEN
jgi:cupin fold WbuC family metalloprotein